jgi:hypothetical protein
MVVSVTLQWLYPDSHRNSRASLDAVVFQPVS